MEPSEQIIQYLSNKTVLILDSSRSFATAISRVLCDLGCQPSQIYKETKFKKAVHTNLANDKPEIVVSEYEVEDGFGLELASMQANYVKNPNDRMFIMVTANSNDSAVAEAADEEIDAYVLKPFTIEQLQKILVTTIKNKLFPSKYQLALQEGKRHLEEKNYSKAQEVFLEAKGIEKKPALACYYFGFSSEKQNHEDLALESYREGQGYNPIHYKCLQGELDILLKRKSNKEAYEVVKTLNQYFPISPKRLGNLFVLAIYTNNYRDLEKYYENFVKLDRREESLVKVVVAGMLAGGKLVLREGNVESAIIFFKKGATAAQRAPGYLRKVIEAFVKNGFFQEAEIFLAMFDPNDMNGGDYAEADFLIAQSILPSEQLIEKCKSMIFSDLATPDVYRIAVGLLVEMERTTAAEDIIYKSMTQYPFLKKELYSLLG